jgi:hypothetical protein
MRRKVRLQLWIEPELEAEILDVLARYRASGKPVAKNALCERLLRDGFRFWAREDQVSNRIEATLAQVQDDLAMTRAMQDALAFQHLGEDEPTFQLYRSEVAKRKGDHNG